jgi:hypothetical protein
MRAEPPSNIKDIASTAAKEALVWGPQFRFIESRIRLLCKAITKVQEGFGYSSALAEWQEAYDSLAPFEGEPPAPAATSEKKPGGKRPGRPVSNEALARDLLDGWRRFEPEEGRRTKRGYISQRPEVRVLKSPEARERQTALLLRMLDSALHLRREKTKQRLRG